MKRTLALALFLTSVPLVSCGSGKEADTQVETAPPAAEPEPAATAESNASTAAYAPLDNPTWGRVIVTGQKADLVTFEAKFREVSGLNDAAAMEANQIGCTEGCAELSSGTPPRLEYIFPREYPNILSFFGQAWDAAQKGGQDPNFEAKLNAAIVSEDCTGAGNPPPCDPMPYCPIDKCGYPPALGACNRC